MNSISKTAKPPSLISGSPFIQSLNRQTSAHTPIWIMRQAGRYLPEYNKVRKEAGSFLKLCKTPELACEVTLQPIRRFGFDAAILFSDILTIPDAMNLGLEFHDDVGPVFANPLRNEADIRAISAPDINSLQYVFDAVSLIRKKMPEGLPLIGFAGSPFTLACYMIEGQGSKNFMQTKRMMFTRPELFHHLLSVLADSVSQYLIHQARSGVNVIQIFDTWGGLLADDDYQKFSLSYMSIIQNNVKSAFPDIPVILFTKGGGMWLESMSKHADALGLDWSVNIHDAFLQVGDKVALQGNLDPLLLLAEPAIFLPKVKAILDDVARARETLQKQGKTLGHVFNLGHGIVPQVPPENVLALVECVQNYKTK